MRYKLHRLSPYSLPQPYTGRSSYERAQHIFHIEITRGRRCCGLPGRLPWATRVWDRVHVRNVLADCVALVCGDACSCVCARMRPCGTYSFPLSFRRLQCPHVIEAENGKTETVSEPRRKIKRKRFGALRLTLSSV